MSGLRVFGGFSDVAGLLVEPGSFTIVVFGALVECCGGGEGAFCGDGFAGSARGGAVEAVWYIWDSHCGCRGAEESV